VKDVVRIFKTADFPWWIAGGYALELFSGKAFREHDDIDVLILDRDKVALRRHLIDWEVWVAVSDEGLWQWPSDVAAMPPFHNIWCRDKGGCEWRFQIMLDDANQSEWVSRRNAGIRMPLSLLTRRTETGIPYVTPEMQLFYKAKAIRSKDEVDFTVIAPMLDSSQKAWLKKVIRQTYGGDHPWVERL
jgi:hypothetical protein